MNSSVAGVAPTPPDARIHALDALRGVALLGIAWANVRQMFMPWEIGNFPVSLGGNETLAQVDWQVFYAFVDLKFLTLFSLLFGFGFALQSERVAARGVGFNALYLRRVGILALFGVAHGVLLYSAEVLTGYAIAGLLLLALQNVSAKNLLRIGLVLLAISVLWGHVLGTFGGSAAAEYQSAQQQLSAMTGGNANEWPEEFRVRREGSFADLVSLHVSQYTDVLLYFGIVLLWRTLGLFMIGAAIFRGRVLERATAQTWVRVMRIALSIGFPFTILATWLHWRELQGEIDWRWPELVHSLSAFALAAGIAAGVFALYARRISSWVKVSSWTWARVEAAGRMALTNYIGQSLVMAAIAEPWGLNLYGRLNGPTMTALAIAVFATLAVLSHIWLSRYRMGPLEWLWRCGTYLSWLPNRRLRSDSRADGPGETAAP
jgi:uncharacterized protein